MQIITIEEAKLRQRLQCLFVEDNKFILVVCVCVCICVMEHFSTDCGPLPGQVLKYKTNREKKTCHQVSGKRDSLCFLRTAA